MENTTFPYKTTLLEASDIKTNRIMDLPQKTEFCRWLICFSENLFQYKNLVESWFDVPITHMPIFILL